MRFGEWCCHEVRNNPHHIRFPDNRDNGRPLPWSCFNPAGIYRFYSVADGEVEVSVGRLGGSKEYYELRRQRAEAERRAHDEFWVLFGPDAKPEMFHMKQSGVGDG